MVRKALANFSPGRTILISIIGMILVGTGLLALPAARTTTMPLIDILFTATSATCVTGLLTIPLEQFTFFGQCIILTLLQIGGLGIITMSLFFISIFLNLGLTTQLMAGQILEVDTWKDVKKIVTLIILITIGAEAFGTLCIFGALNYIDEQTPSIFLALFHAISSFCNVGMSLFPPEIIHNSIILMTTTLLILIGGLGFITWYEIFCYALSFFRKKPYRFSLHSKIVLYGSAAIITSSMVIFWLLERNNVLQDMNLAQTSILTLFNVVSLRGTGFLATSAKHLLHPTKLFVMVISFIGSSPLSTGSGVKITTFVIFLFIVKTALLGKTSVNIKGRCISIDQTYKAIAIIALSMGWIMITAFCLLITETNISFFDILFEAVSAFTNLGLSTDVSPQLSIIGKCFIIISMLIGRIGSMGFILALKAKPNTDVREFSYPEERVMLG